MKVNLSGIKEAILELQDLKHRNREAANRIIRVTVRLCAQHVVKSHTDAARHTPAYSGNLLSNWHITLGGKALPYRETSAYKQRQPLAGEELNYFPLNGYQEKSWQQLAQEKRRELSEATYGITWQSRVTLGNASPYWVTDDGQVEGTGITGKYFKTRQLRPANTAAVSQAKLEAFVDQVVPKVIAAVLAGQSRITFNSLTEVIDV